MADMTANPRQASKEEMARRIMESMQENEERERPKKKRPPQKRSGSGNNKSSKKKPAKKKRMSGFKAAVIAFIIVLAIVLIFLAIVYFHGLREAQGKFLKNTTINGIDVSGMNEADAYTAVSGKTRANDAITILKIDGGRTEIPLSDIGYQDNVKTMISQYMSQQNYYAWFSDSPRTYRFETAFTYDRTLLRAELKTRIVDTSGKVQPADAYIKYVNGTFEVVKEHRGDKIDDTKLDDLIDFVESKIKLDVYEIDLETCDIYQAPKIFAADLEDKLKELESLEDVLISFDFDYETTTLTGTEFMSWVSFEDGNALNEITVDRNKAMAYVERIAEEYDTYKKPRKFNSTSRGEIVVEQGEGCYGWWIDQEKMCDLVIDLIKKGKDTTAKPIYYITQYSNYEYACDPKYRTKDTDFGNTYCEVDLEKQHFWYYENGEMKYECDIVSGKDTEERRTPGGVYKLWLKEKNKVLTGSTAAGETWNTPVTYWNNISTFGVGLHDSTWRSAFGGKVYVYNGSHGCINMPYKAAEFVYNNVPIGTPVFMYW